MSNRSLLLSLVAALCALTGFTPSASAAPADLDPTFASNGILFQRFAAADWGRGSDVVVQPDGKILVGGEGYPDGGGSGSAQLLARFNPDGSLDHSFGIGGYVMTDYATSDDDVVSDIALLPDGRILTGGSADWDSDDDSTLTRYLPNGVLDDSFDGDGKLRFDADLGDTDVDNLSRVAIAPDGKVVVAGSAYRSPDFDAYVKRFNENGTPDVTFNSGNTYFRHFNNNVADSNDFATGLIVRADKRIVVAAKYESSATTTDAALFGLDSNGLSDTTFGSGASGTRLLASGSLSAYPTDFIEQPDGKLVLLFADYSDSTATTGMTRWDANASTRDAGFGTAGVLAVSKGTENIQPNAFARLADGSFLVGGYHSDGTPNDNGFFLKVTAGGTTDPAFGSNGLRIVDSGAPSERFSDVAVQADGKFLSVGPASGSPLPASSMEIVRLLGNYVAPPVPPATVALTAKIKSPSKSKLKASKLKSISGTAVGTGLAKVQIAIQKIDAKLLKKKKKCLFVKNSKGATKSYKAVKKKCVPTRLLAAKGTASWSYKIKLKPGKYKLTVQPVDAAGKVGRPILKTFKLTK
jgi:uncharacterized delta-60 repeat protein